MTTLSVRYNYKPEPIGSLSRHPEVSEMMNFTTASFKSGDNQVHGVTHDTLKSIMAQAANHQPEVACLLRASYSLAYYNHLRSPHCTGGRTKKNARARLVIMEEEASWRREEERWSGCLDPDASSTALAAPLQCLTLSSEYSCSTLRRPLSLSQPPSFIAGDDEALTDRSSLAADTPHERGP